MYNTDLQSRMYNQSSVQVPASMEAPGRDPYYPNQVGGARHGVSYHLDTEGTHSRHMGSTMDQGFGVSGGQIRGRRDTRHPHAEYGYGVLDSQADSSYVPVVSARHSGHGNSPRYRKPANYDGKTDWQDYFVQFEMVAELNQWDDRTKALELATNLRGVAQGVLSDLRPEHRMSYRHLVFALQSRFEPTNQSELYRAQIKNRIRKKGEALTELAQDVKRLVRLAYPESPSAVREHLARDCFIDSLNDSELEWAVFQGKAYTVEDAVRVGLEYEAFDAGHRKRTAVKTNIRMQRDVGDDEAGSEHGMTNDLIHEVIGRLARMETETVPKPSWGGSDINRRRPGRCHHCDGEGHWKMECPNRPYNGANRDNQGPNRQYNGANRDNQGLNRQYSGVNRDNQGPNRQYSGANRENNGPIQSRFPPSQTNRPASGN
jgi:hypothetical protein